MQTDTVTPTTAPPGMRDVRLIDCDVHFRWDPDELHDYLPEPWRSRRNLVRVGKYKAIYGGYSAGMRVDANPPSGGPPGSDPDLMSRQLFVDAGIDFAINTVTGRHRPVDPELQAAMSTALNVWHDETWLSKHNEHGRYKCSIAIAVDNIPSAVREIERWAGHPHYIQVSLPAYAGLPYGYPQFDPLWEVVSRHHLPVAIHVDSGAGDPHVTPVGFVQRYPEDNGIGYPATYAAQLVSMLTQGVFTRFPDLRVVFVEGGFSWVGPVVSALDRNWELLGAEAVHVDRRPSLYLRDHVRFSSQPVESPENLNDLVAMYEWCDASHLLMFSSDYPHWDYDHPSRAISPRLGKELRQRIYVENALEFYGLPRTRPADEFDAMTSTLAAAQAAEPAEVVGG